MEIATRTITLRDSGRDIDIPIRVLAPVQREARAWSCHYEIDWPEGKEARDIWGYDSVQAILLTFQAIGADIYTSSYHKSGNLFCERFGDGYGFPVPNNMRDLLEGDDTKYF
jgi:hypothetical protein